MEKVVTAKDYPPSIQSEKKIVKEGRKITVSKSYLINKLNYIHFQSKTILLYFKHKKYNQTITRTVKPQPCIGDHLDCLWTRTDGLDQIFNSFRFQNFIITNKSNLLTVQPELIDIGAEGVCFKLPETGYQTHIQQVRRHSCKALTVQLIQNSMVFHGALSYFNARSFHVEITMESPQTFQWINPESSVNVIFSNSRETLYTGDCRITNYSSEKKTISFILEPLHHRVHRFKPQQFRSKRQKLIPTPNITFSHPFTGRMIDLKVLDLAGSGVSVEEDADNSMLLPGMIIPELELNFTLSFKIKLQAQVIYRNHSGDEKQNGPLKCGLVFLDMAPDDHMKLLSLLQHADNENAYVCNPVDMDDLWDFFFEAGFIYPKKYACIQANKEEIKKTYNKLYTNKTSISRHFIYQEKGTILGHTAMLRFYENTWLIHHHASISALMRAGLVVMDQIGRYSYESHRLHSSHMDYIIFYFRPDNKFPNLVFGGAARNINNPEMCSLDNFAYLHYQRTLYDKPALPGFWRLTKSLPEDLIELKSFYKRESGGLMIQALDLDSGPPDGDGLSKEYERFGFKRKRHLFSLRMYGSLKAVIMANLSDVGLNLSDLTNCIKVFVIDRENLPGEVLLHVFSYLTEKINQNRIPVLIYPSFYADEQAIPYEKLYTLWALDTQHSDHYFKHVTRLLKFQSS